MHFAGEYKPWNNLRIRYAKEWWAWAQEALEENEYNKLYFQVKELTEKNDWTYILNRCIREKKIIIVGYSRIGVDVFVSLKKCNVMAEIFFCDNSKKKRDLSNIEITIHTVEELKRKYPQALWIITSQRSSEIINSQLIELGITEEKIITYINKEGIYYDMLDDAYIEYELNQMRLKNVGNTDKIGEYR